MNLALEQHISKIKSQLLLREMHESYLHSGYTRSAPHTNMDALYTAMMTATHPAHQHLPQLNMMPIIQQLILKSALLNQQQVASNHLMEHVGLLKPAMIEKMSAFTPVKPLSPNNSALPQHKKSQHMTSLPRTPSQHMDSLLTPPHSEKSISFETGSESQFTLTPKSQKLQCRADKKPSPSPAMKKRKQKDVKVPTKKQKTEEGKTTRKSSPSDQSPVSGILIRKKLHKKKETNEEGKETPEQNKGGDIDSKYNVVDRSSDSRDKLAKITNVIGDFTCRLCEETYTDVYELAEHQCPSIIYIEYKCPECNKAFNCPANLASHRRWHKPKQQTGINKTNLKTPLQSSILSNSEKENATSSGLKQKILASNLSTHGGQFINVS